MSGLLEQAVNGVVHRGKSGMVAIRLPDIQTIHSPSYHGRCLGFLQENTLHRLVVRIAGAGVGRWCRCGARFTMASTRTSVQARREAR